jgi:hypothetical protein
MKIKQFELENIEKHKIVAKIEIQISTELYRELSCFGISPDQRHFVLVSASNEELNYVWLKGQKDLTFRLEQSNKLGNKPIKKVFFTSSDIIYTTEESIFVQHIEQQRAAPISDLRGGIVGFSTFRSFV